MKESVKKWAALLLCMLVILNIGGCMHPNPLGKISRALQVDVTRGTVISESDDHGGFHGDGQAFMKIQFSDSKCIDEIKKSPVWKTLPMTDTVSVLVYGLESEDIRMEPMVKDQTGKPLLPNVKNGYYCFMDRFSQGEGKYDDTEVMSRAAFNFTLAVYDADTSILYYVELDT